MLMTPLFRSMALDLAGSVHVPNLLQGIVAGMRSTIIPILAKEIFADDATIGWITACAGIARMAVNIPAGALTTRIGFVAVMNLGMVGIIIGALLTAASLTSFDLCVSNLFYGAGSGVFILARHVMLAKLVDRTQRGRLMSMVGGGERWSSAIGPAIAGWLIECVGSRFCSCLSVLAALACVCCVSSSAKAHGANEARGEETLSQNNNFGKPHQQTYKTMTTTPAFFWSQHSGVMLRVGIYAMNIMQLRTCRKLLLPLAAVKTGLGPAMVGLIVTLSFMVDATMFFLGGMITDRYGRLYAAIPTSANLGIAFYILSQADSTYALALAAIAFGIADSLGAGLLLTLSSDCVPQQHSATAKPAEFLGVFRTIQDSGQFIGPLFAAWICQIASFEVACKLLCSLGFFNAAWALLFLPPDNNLNSSNRTTADSDVDENDASLVVTATDVALHSQSCGLNRNVMSHDEDADDVRLPQGAGKLCRAMSSAVVPPSLPFMVRKHFQVVDPELSNQALVTTAIASCPPRQHESSIVGCMRV